jgi:nucleoside-diphosphate-sugar epimerase
MNRFADVLIIGCGYLGRVAAREWINRGRRVAALTRSRPAELAALGIEPIIGDVMLPDSLANLPAAQTVLYAVGLDRNSGRSMQEVYVRGLENVLTALPPPRKFVYVSSTSVYGQTDGGWVDEDVPTEPLEPSGRTVLDAEAMLRSKLPSAITLRFAGIYGPGRLLRKAAILAHQPLGGDPVKWLNLIHVVDGAQAVLAAESASAPGAIWNIADESPPTRLEFYSLLATLLQAPPPNFTDVIPAARETHRRIDSRRARSQLGLNLRYPRFAEGLPAAIAAPDS